MKPASGSDAPTWPEPVALGFDESTSLGQWQAWINHDHLQVKMRVAALEKELAKMRMAVLERELQDLPRLKDGEMPGVRGSGSRGRTWRRIMYDPTTGRLSMALEDLRDRIEALLPPEGA